MLLQTLNVLICDFSFYAILHLLVVNVTAIDFVLDFYFDSFQSLMD